MRNIRVDLEYLGTNYCGWERQPGLISIRETIENVLSGILGEKIELTVAGRTDAGVHAKAQSGNFRTKSGMALDRMWWAANALLPDDIAITDAREVDPDFDARRDALWRQYEYQILNRRYRSVFLRDQVLFVARLLDCEAMDQALREIIGKHDFSAFSASGYRANKHCTVFEASCRRRGDLVVITVRADTFVRHMMRILAGTLVEIGLGRRNAEEMAEILTGRDRTKAGQTAPAKGLILTAVGYPDEVK